MTIQEAQLIIPSKFRIACNTIEVSIEEKGESFGQFDSLRNKIILYLEVEDSNRELVAQTKEQLINTFYHELFHCFNFFYNTEFDEGLSQSFANFMCEYLETKKSNENI